MTLLFDRIMSEGYKIYGKRENLSTSIEPEVIQIENVARYFHTQVYTSKMQWGWDEFPSIAPPFPLFWMEFTLRPEYFDNHQNAFMTDTGLICEAQELRDQTQHESNVILRRHFFSILQKQPADHPMMQHLHMDVFKKDPINAVWSALLTAMTIEFKGAINNEQVIRLCEALKDVLPIRWWMKIDVFIQMNGHGPIAPFFNTIVFIRDDGSVYAPNNHASAMMMSFHAQDEDQRQIMKDASFDMFGSYVGPAMMALSFMHCRNVRLEQQIPPSKLSHARKKRYGKPLVRYHTLDIQPMQRVLRDQSEKEHTTIRQSLHIMRGHFKHYGSQWGTKKLFGKLEGTYWWGDTVRGSVHEGIVDKDYRAHPEKESR